MMTEYIERGEFFDSSVWKSCIVWGFICFDYSCYRSAKRILIAENRDGSCHGYSYDFEFIGWSRVVHLVEADDLANDYRGLLGHAGRFAEWNTGGNDPSIGRDFCWLNGWNNGSHVRCDGRAANDYHLFLGWIVDSANSGIAAFYSLSKE